MAKHSADSKKGQQNIKQNSITKINELPESQPKKKMRTWVKVLIVCLSVIIVLLACGVGYGYYLLHKMTIAKNYQPEILDEDWLSGEDGENGDAVADDTLDENFGLDDVVMHGGQDGIYNVMVFGTDTRSMENLTTGLTDVIMIVSLDTKTKHIRLVSILRDTLVPIPGTTNSFNRVNSLNKRLGTERAAQEIGKMFGISIDRFVVVNFRSVATIIDAVGGVEIEITKKEATALNKLLDDEYKSMPSLFKGKGVQKVSTSGGKIKMNGVQAMTYGRIRKIDSDFSRTDRQRKVFIKAVDAIQSMTLTQMLTMVPELTDYVRTNMSEIEILSYVKTFFDLRKTEIQQMRIPNDKTWKNARVHGAAVLKIDFAQNSRMLQEFLYGDEAVVN